MRIFLIGASNPLDAFNRGIDQNVGDFFNANELLAQDGRLLVAGFWLR